MSTSSWILPDGTKYDVKKKDIVHKIEGREHYYICVKNNLKLGAEFITAMKKGIVSKSYCSTGIKFFKNANSVECVEIKTHGGDRAWSKTMVVNPQGDYLIIIDGYGNHTAAAKALRTGINIISVPSTPYDKAAESAGAGGYDHHHTVTDTTFADHTKHHPQDEADLLGDS